MSEDVQSSLTLHTSIDLDQRSLAGNRIPAPTALFSILRLNQLLEQVAQLDLCRLEAACQGIRVAVTETDELRVAGSWLHVRDIDQLEGTGEWDLVALQATDSLVGEVERQVLSLVEQPPVRCLGKLDVIRLQEKLPNGFLQRGD